MPISTLGSDTVHALECLRSLNDTLRLALRDKNSDELVQDTLRLLWQESQGPSDEDDEDEEPVPYVYAFAEEEEDEPGDEDLHIAVLGTARAWGHPDGELASAGLHLRRLATIFVTNPEVREALTGLLGVARDMLPSELRPPLPAPSKTINGPPDTPPTESLHVPGGWSGRSWSGSQSGSEFDEFEDARSEVSLDEASAAFLNLVRRAVASLQAEPGFASSLSWLLALLEAYDAELVRVVKGVPAQTPTRRILRNVALFSDRFASGPATPLQSALIGLYVDAGNNLGLGLLWRDIDAYVRAVLLEPGYVHTSVCVEQGLELHARARQWLDDALYRHHWAELVRGVNRLLGWAPPPEEEPEDQLKKRLIQNGKDLFAAIALDARGHLTWKPKIWTDVAGMLAPHLRSLGALCIPRVEFITPNLEIVLENVALDWADVLPSVLSWEMYEALRWSVHRTNVDESTSRRVRLRIEEMHADVRGGLGCIWIKPWNLRDTGLVDIQLARGGVSTEVDLDIDLRPGAAHILKPVNAAVKIDGLSMRVRESALGIDWLYRILLPLAAVPWLRNTLQEKWTEMLQEALERLDYELVLVRDRLQAEGETPDLSRLMQVLVQRWREVQAEPPPIRPSIFKISARLEDAVVDTTRSAEESWVYRRWRAEQAARAQVRADARVQLLPCAAVGLFASERKPWASPIFTVPR